jgi:hypothetical protein
MADLCHFGIRHNGVRQPMNKSVSISGVQPELYPSAFRMTTVKSGIVVLT